MMAPFIAILRLFLLARRIVLDSMKNPILLDFISSHKNRAMPPFPSKVSTACTISQLCEEAEARGYVVGTMPFTKQMLLEMLGNGTKCMKAKQLAANVRKSDKSRADSAARPHVNARLENTTKKKDGSTRPSVHRNGTQKQATRSTTADEWRVLVDVV